MAVEVALIGGAWIWYKIPPKEYSLKEGQKRKKVVILGSGWGALSVINNLTPGQFDVTVVSPRNYYLFTPLLPSVTVGTVESRSIVEPIRKLACRYHRKTPIKFLEAECVDIDHIKKHVKCEDTSEIVGEVSKWDLPYDYLVVAVGATSNTFNTPGVTEHCHFLKEIPDAQKIRNAIIDLVETASIPGQTEAEQRRLLNFVVVGGGPTGVEFAAEVQDFLREDVGKIYPGIKEKVRVTLVQSRDHILNTYDQTISEYAEKTFKSDSINLITNSRWNIKLHRHLSFLSSSLSLLFHRVTEVTADCITVMDKKTRKTEQVPYGLCVWSTGVAPIPLTKKFLAKVPQQGKG